MHVLTGDRIRSLVLACALALVAAVAIGAQSAHAFKPYTHVEIAKDVRADVLEDGKLTIGGHDYDVHPKFVEALERFPSYYYGGAVGPDGFPDLLMGQGVIHPDDTGTWLARIFDMAWQAQTSPQYTADEKLQILAWSYGFATHAAGDVFAHTLVNEFSEGVFPSAADVALDQHVAAGEQGDHREAYGTHLAL